MGFRCYRATDHRLSPVMSSETTPRHPVLMWDNSKPTREACCGLKALGLSIITGWTFTVAMGSVCVSGLPCDVWGRNTLNNKSNIDIWPEFDEYNSQRVIYLEQFNNAWVIVCVWVTGLRSSQECLCTGKIHCKYIFPFSFSWLYLDYNHANEKCLPHISSTCWRDDVGVTKPHSSNRAIWSLWFAFLGWLLTPVWGLWLLSWETPGSWCCVFQREEEDGNLGCTATLCCRKRFPASGAAVEKDWAPPHCYKPPLYCGWGS